MNTNIGGFQSSPKLRLSPGSVLVVVWRLLLVLLVEVGEVAHEVVEVE